MEPMQLHINQKFTRRVDGKPYEIKIVKLGLVDLEFTITGAGVENPDQVRVIPILAFIHWLEMLEASDVPN